MGEAAALLPDPRVRHFWDGDRVVGRAFQPVLGSSEPAWDVWMLFDRSATWEKTPVPGLWAHQHKAAGLPAGRELDADRFSSEAEKLLG